MRNVDMMAHSNPRGELHPTRRFPAGYFYQREAHGHRAFADQGISIWVQGRIDRGDVSAHYFNVCFRDSEIDIRDSRRDKSDSQANGVCSYPRHERAARSCPKEAKQVRSVEGQMHLATCLDGPFHTPSNRHARARTSVTGYRPLQLPTAMIHDVTLVILR